MREFKELLLPLFQFATSTVPLSDHTLRSAASTRIRLPAAVASATLNLIDREVKGDVPVMVSRMPRALLVIAAKLAVPLTDRIELPAVISSAVIRSTIELAPPPFSGFRVRENSPSSVPA